MYIHHSDFPMLGALGTDLEPTRIEFPDGNKSITYLQVSCILYVRV